MPADIAASRTSPFSAVLFDLDGTLADSAQCGILATHATCEAFGLTPPSATDIVRHMGIPIEISFPLMVPALRHPTSLERVIRRFRAEYAVLGERHIGLFAGIREMLDDLRDGGTPMAIVTSKHAPVARRNMATLGIAGYFRAVVGPDMVPRPKPAPDTAHLALSLLGVAASRDVVVVGDASFDMAMGRNAALQTCAVGWGAHSLADLSAAQPTYSAATVRELRDLLVRPGVAELVVGSAVA